MKEYIIWYILLTCWKYSGLVLPPVSYPSIIWDPWHPLFACETPKITVRLNDGINFHCPSTELQNFMPIGTPAINMYENMYFLGQNKLMYESCNATGAINILNCTYEKNNLKYYTVTFRHYGFPNTPKFTAGKSHYFIDDSEKEKIYIMQDRQVWFELFYCSELRKKQILHYSKRNMVTVRTEAGTGFRTKNNLANKVGGSCEKAGSTGQHKLRLEVYVCTEDEKQSGKCEMCETNGCYYKDCGELNCTDWSVPKGNSILIDESGKNCSRLLQRKCMNSLIRSSVVEYKKQQISCPAITGKTNCSDWFSTGDIFLDTSTKRCIEIMQRTCIHSFFGNNTEYNSIENSSCSTPSTDENSIGPITGETMCPSPSISSNDSSDKTLKYVLIAGFSCICIGAILGVLGHKKIHSRKCKNTELYKNKVIDGKTEKDDGFVNKAYRESISVPCTDATVIQYDSIKEEVGGVC